MTVWVCTVQIPAVVYKLKSLMQLFLRFNRIRVVDNDVRKLKVCCSSNYHILFSCCRCTTKVISGEHQKVRQKAVRWPCGVCSKGVGSNSLQYNSCQKWVHKKCSGIMGSMSKVAKSYISVAV